MTTERSTLVVAWQVPFPPDRGGRIWSFHLIRALRELGRVTVVCVQHTPEEGRSIEALEEQGFSVVPLPGPSVRFRWWDHLASAQPVLAKQYGLPALRRRLSALALAHNRYDLVMVDGLFIAPCVREIGGVPLLYAAHNVESEIYQRSLRLMDAPLKSLLAARVDCWKLARFERHAVRRFPFIAAVSARDRDWFQACAPAASVFVVPNGADCGRLRPVPTVAAEPGALVFVANLSYLPSRDAVLYFGREIFPRIRNEMPSVKWYVVGEDPESVRRAFRNDPGIIFTGYVDDVREYVARSQVVVVPLRAGGGTRLKILEAMAMGRPVVSTSLGAEGLELRDGTDILVADTPEAFASAVLRVLKVSGVENRLATAGRRAVLERYDWGSITRGFQDAILRIWENQPAGTALKV